MQLFWTDWYFAFAPQDTSSLKHWTTKGNEECKTPQVLYEWNTVQHDTSLKQTVQILSHSWANCHVSSKTDASLQQMALFLINQTNFKVCECQEWLNDVLQKNTVAFYKQIHANTKQKSKLRLCLVVLMIITRGRTLHTVKCAVMTMHQLNYKAVYCMFTVVGDQSFFSELCFICEGKVGLWSNVNVWICVLINVWPLANTVMTEWGEGVGGG